MGFLSNLTELIASGVTWAIQKIISSGGWFIAALSAFVLWITGTLVGVITGLISPLMAALPDMAGFLGGLPAIALWAWGLFYAPRLIPEWAGAVVKFIIRRIPVIG